MVSGKNITALNSLVEAKGSAFAAAYKRQQQKATDTSQSLCSCALMNSFDFDIIYIDLTYR